MKIYPFAVLEKVTRKASGYLDMDSLIKWSSGVKEYHYSKRYSLIWCFYGINNCVVEERGQERNRNHCLMSKYLVVARKISQLTVCLVFFPISLAVSCSSSHYCFHPSMHCFSSAILSIFYLPASRLILFPRRTCVS